MTKLSGETIYNMSASKSVASGQVSVTKQPALIPCLPTIIFSLSLHHCSVLLSLFYNVIYAQGFMTTMMKYTYCTYFIIVHGCHIQTRVITSYIFLCNFQYIYMHHQYFRMHILAVYVFDPRMGVQNYTLWRLHSSYCHIQTRIIISYTTFLQFSIHFHPSTIFWPDDGFTQFFQ